MSEESLVPDTCYICLEECHEVSPCDCQAPVHKKCILKYHLTSGKTHCTICQSPLQLSKTQKCTTLACFIALCVQSCIVGILGGIFAYISCGFLGIYIWTAFGICECVVYRASFVETLATSGFVYSSFSMMFIIAVGIQCLHLLIRNYMSH